MDPLSITASSIAVLSAVTASGRGFSKLISLRRAPAEVLALSNEVQALRSLLAIVQNSLLQIQGTKTYRTNEKELTSLLQTVKDCVLDFEKTIEYRLKRAEASSPDGIPKISHSHWLRAAPEIERLRQRIQDARSNLNVGLMAINIEIGQVCPAETVRRTAVEIQSITFTSEDTNGYVGIVPYGNLDPPDSIDADPTTKPPIKPPQIVPCTDEELDMPDRSLAVSSPILTKPSEISTNIIRSFGHRGNEYPSDDIIRVRTTITVRRCERLCQCQCHVSTYIKTPQWLRRTLGQLMFSYTNIIRPKPCNYPPCNRSPKKAHFTYMFPWWLASRALIASCMVDNLTGSTAGWALRMPIVLPRDHMIWVAVVDDNVSYLKRMFGDGQATPFAVTDNGWSLLHYAVTHEVHETYQFLLDQGVPDDIENEARETPASTALRSGWAEEFQYDVEDIAEELRFTPIHLAIVAPSLQSTFTREFLKQEWAHINTADKLGMTPLHWASRLGNAEAVRLLLEWKADINLLTASGKSVLHEACWGDDVECVELLQNAGCDVNLRDREGETPLFELKGGNNSEEILDMLIQCGINVHCTNPTGETPLHTAASRSHTGLVQTFLSRGVSINATNKYRDPILHIAVMWDQARNIEAISQASKLNEIPLELNSNKNDRNVLHLAALYASATSMMTLADIDLVGIDPMAEDCDGHTPNSCFYESRDELCTIVRTPFDIEEAAWITLLESVCRQNDIDPTTLDWYQDEYSESEPDDTGHSESEASEEEDERSSGVSVASEIGDADVAESAADDEEDFADALENLGE